MKMRQSNKLHVLTFIIPLFMIFTHISGADDIIIGDVRFQGLKRTKDHIALEIIRPVKIGDIYTEETEGLIIQELRESGIFNPEITTRTNIEGDIAIIDVFLRDRWTLIPIPLFSFSKSGSWSVGILGIESNFLGYYKTLGLGFFFGSEGWTLLSFYNDRIFLGTDMKLTAGFTLGLNEVIDENVYEGTIREYQSDDISLSFGLEYPFSEEFSIAGSWGYNRSILRPESFAATGIPDLHSTGIIGEIKWKDLYYDIPFEYGFLAKTSIGWNWGFDGTPDYLTVNGRIKWSLNPSRKHLFVILGNAAWAQNLPVQQHFRLGGSPGSRVLPMGRIPADEYADSAVEYNVPLWFFPGGTLSSKVFYEIGYYKSDIVTRTLFHGPGLGIEIYINNLAIPALQFNVAWNLETNRYQFNVGVGMAGGNPD